MMLLPQSLDLLRIQPRHGKHANLEICQSIQIGSVRPSGNETYIGKYMVPRPRCLTLPKPLHQSPTHRSHAPTHMREICYPLRSQLFIPKNLRNDPGAIDGSSRDLSARKPRKHAESLRPSALRATYYVQSTHTLAVQTEILGEGLCDQYFL